MSGTRWLNRTVQPARVGSFRRPPVCPITASIASGNGLLECAMVDAVVSILVSGFVYLIYLRLGFTHSLSTAY